MPSIYCPIATGNGAYIVHKQLALHLDDYQVLGYHPWWTLIPFAFPFFKKRRCDIVHTTPDYVSLFRCPSAKIISTIHNYVLDEFMRCYSSTLQRLHYQTDLKWFIRNGLQRSDAVTCVSSFTASLVREHMGYTGKIAVIPNGIDANYFRKTPCAKAESRQIKALFCGNATKRKGAHWLMRIAERLSSDIDILYTSGLRNTKFAFDHPNLHCIGTLKHEKMPDLYNKVDMLLMPTVREGMSLAVLEAMACELPVIATDCSSMPELINDGKGGFLCTLGNEVEFAEKINFLADSPELRKQMGEYNRAKVEKMFTVEHMVSQYKNLFEEVMG